MEEEKAIFVGHDWGAMIVWEMALMHPERVEAVVGVSVPFMRFPMVPTQACELLSGGNFFYVLYFQEVGPAEKELQADPRATMAKVLWSVSGDAIGPEPGDFTTSLSREGTGFLTATDEPPRPLPAWLTDDDIDEYARQFTRSGFFGPVSYYRNLDRNYEHNKDLLSSRMTMPSHFIGGDRDPVIARNLDNLDPMMRDALPDFRGTVIVPGAGHWIQQERPAEFNDALVSFLKSL